MFSTDYDVIAEELWESGFRPDEGIIDQILESNVSKLQNHYNDNLRTEWETPLNYDKAKAVLKSYENKRKIWEETSQSDDSVGIGGTIVLFLIMALFFLYRQIKRFISNMIISYKMAKIIDLVNDKNNSPEMDEKCKIYKEMLSNPETCPKDVKAIANTTKYMSYLGAYCMILGAFSLLFLFLKRHSAINIFHNYTFYLCFPFMIFAVSTFARSKKASVISFFVLLLSIALYMFELLFVPIDSLLHGKIMLHNTFNFVDPRLVFSLIIFFIGLLVFWLIVAIYYSLKNRNIRFEKILISVYCIGMIVLQLYFNFGIRAANEISILINNAGDYNFWRYNGSLFVFSGIIILYLMFNSKKNSENTKVKKQKKEDAAAA